MPDFLSKPRAPKSPHFFILIRITNVNIMSLIFHLHNVFSLHFSFFVRTWSDFTFLCLFMFVIYVCLKNLFLEVPSAVL